MDFILHSNLFVISLSSVFWLLISSVLIFSLHAFCKDELLPASENAYLDMSSNICEAGNNASDEMGPTGGTLAMRPTHDPCVPLLSMLCSWKYCFKFNGTQRWDTIFIILYASPIHNERVDNLSQRCLVWHWSLVIDLSCIYYRRSLTWYKCFHRKHVNQCIIVQIKNLKSVLSGRHWKTIFLP